MAKLNIFPSLTILSILILSEVFSVTGQISTPCSSSMLSSVMPCMGLITGSSRNGAAPPSSCCDTLKSMTSKSMDCVCLIVTGNVPLPSFVSQALAIALPQTCGSSVPLQCKSSSVALPSGGPVLFAPPPPPAAISPRQILSPAESPDISPAASSSLISRVSKALGLLTAPVPADETMELLAPASAPVSDGGPEN